MSDSDLKNLLAKKGIFVSSKNRETTVPLVTMSLLSPLEFEELREKQKDKESTIKRRNREFEWNSDENLFTALKGVDVPIKDLVPRHSSNYEIKNMQNLKPVEGNLNHLKASYEIVRTDRTKDWAAQHSNHTGIFEFRLSDDKKILKIAMEHTADETHTINERSVKYFSDYLVSKNYVAQKKSKKITYGEFNNANRIKFFLNLLNSDLDVSETFKFKQLTNVEISIDTEKTLPDDIKWMEDKVDNMRFKGKSLHETDLLRDPKYHDALILSGVRANYTFNSTASAGTCTFEFGFPFRGSIPSEDTEFIYKLVNFNYESENKTRGKVQGYLYSQFDNFKSNAFNYVKEPDSE